jgi:hypothetical protein
VLTFESDGVMTTLNNNEKVIKSCCVY